MAGNGVQKSRFPVHRLEDCESRVSSFSKVTPCRKLRRKVGRFNLEFLIILSRNYP